MLRTKNLKVEESEINNNKKNRGAALSAVGASDEFDMAAAVFVATSIPALECLQTTAEDSTLRRRRR